jgi:sterol desaturase/sphingolipid hydroxylase (fatty acid hydroxylase superfamily)
LVVTLRRIAAAATTDLLESLTNRVSVVGWQGAIRFSVYGLIVLGLSWGFDQVDDRPRLFPRKVFLSRSTWQDLGIIVVTAFLVAIPAVLWRSIDEEISVLAGWISSAFRRGGDVAVASPSAGHEGHASIRVARVVIVVLSADLASYCYHNLMHRVSWLWEFHKVHHSAAVLTPFTSQRVHVAEILLRSLFVSLILGLTTGATSFLLGDSTADVATGFTIYAYLFAYVLLLNHSHIWWSWGKAEYLLNSPAMHAIHHSRDPKHFNKNLGNLLSIWDVMFGTFYKPTRRPEPVEFGVEDAFDWGSASLVQMFVRPFVAILGQASKRASTPKIESAPPTS